MDVVLVGLPVIVLDRLDVSVAVLETVVDAEVVVVPDMVLLEAIVGLELEDPLVLLELRAVDVPHDDINDVFE